MDWRAPDPDDRDAWRRWHTEYDTNYDREVRRGHLRGMVRMAAVGVFMLSSMSGFTILMLQLFG